MGIGEVDLPVGFPDHQWARLLNEVHRNKLVPVVGRELLTVGEGDDVSPLWELAARQVASRLGLEEERLPATPSLADVAYADRERGSDPIDVYYAAADVLSDPHVPVPTALRDLARIRACRLFVSTTPDDMLVRALREARPGEEIEVLAYAPKVELQDLPLTYEPHGRHRTVVYKLFGDAAMRPDYAITDEDILKVVHHLQIRDERPANLFDHLRSASLALVGCNFPDWLVRFIYCSAKPDAIFGALGTRGVVADRTNRVDPQLRPFLERNRTLLYPGDAAEFVRALRERWEATQEASESTCPSRETSITDSPGTPHVGEEHAVFLSYASQDVAVAERIRHALEAAGLGVWMDRTRLRGGTPFEIEITQRIQACALFVPVISAHTDVADRRFFRLEWRLGIEESRKWPDTYPFIQPVAIDDTLPESEHLPPEFARLHWSRVRDGVVDPSFVNHLLRTLERYKKRAML